MVFLFCFVFVCYPTIKKAATLWDVDIRQHWCYNVREHLWNKWWMHNSLRAMVSLIEMSLSLYLMLIIISQLTLLIQMAINGSFQFVIFWLIFSKLKWPSRNLYLCQDNVGTTCIFRFTSLKRKLSFKCILAHIIQWTQKLCWF